MSRCQWRLIPKNNGIVFFGFAKVKSDEDLFRSRISLKDTSPSHSKTAPSDSATNKISYHGIPNYDVDQMEVNDLHQLEEKYEKDTDDQSIKIDMVESDGKYPVLPLIIPNNCDFDQKTGKMVVNQSKHRNKLIIHQPVLSMLYVISTHNQQK